MCSHIPCRLKTQVTMVSQVIITVLICILTYSVNVCVWNEPVELFLKFTHTQKLKVRSIRP